MVTVSGTGTFIDGELEAAIARVVRVSEQLAPSYHAPSLCRSGALDNHEV